MPILSRELIWVGDFEPSLEALLASHAPKLGDLESCRLGEVWEHLWTDVGGEG